MKRISVYGEIIAYEERNVGCGPTILFIHGNSQSSRSFINQLNASIFSNFHLIAIDLLGHGESSPAKLYSLTYLGQKISEFISLLGLTDVFLVGHSLGGHVAIQSLNFFTPKRLFLFGTPPLHNPVTLDGFLPNPKSAPLCSSTATESELEGLLDELNLFGENRLNAKVDYQRTDKLFRQMIFATTFQNQHTDEWRLLKNFKGETQILFLSHDTLVNNEYILHEATTLSTILMDEMDADHSPHQNRPEKFNQRLLRFVTKESMEQLIVNRDVFTQMEMR